jgi:hypothetical protein
MRLNSGLLYYYYNKVIHVYHCILRLSIAQRGRWLVVWDYSAGWSMDFRRLKFHEGHFDFFSTSSTVVLEL